MVLCSRGRSTGVSQWPGQITGNTAEAVCVVG